MHRVGQDLPDRSEEEGRSLSVDESVVEGEAQDGDVS